MKFKKRGGRLGSSIGIGAVLALSTLIFIVFSSNVAATTCYDLSYENTCSGSRPAPYWHNPTSLACDYYIENSGGTCSYAGQKCWSPREVVCSSRTSYDCTSTGCSRKASAPAPPSP